MRAHPSPSRQIEIEMLRSSVGGFALIALILVGRSVGRMHCRHAASSSRAAQSATRCRFLSRPIFRKQPFVVQWPSNNTLALSLPASSSPAMGRTAISSMGCGRKLLTPPSAASAMSGDASSSSSAALALGGVTVALKLGGALSTLLRRRAHRRAHLPGQPEGAPFLRVESDAGGGLQCGCGMKRKTTVPRE